MQPIDKSYRAEIYHASREGSLTRFTSLLQIIIRTNNEQERIILWQHVIVALHDLPDDFLPENFKIITDPVSQKAEFFPVMFVKFACGSPQFLSDLLCLLFTKSVCKFSHQKKIVDQDPHLNFLFLLVVQKYYIFLEKNSEDITEEDLNIFVDYNSETRGTILFFTAAAAHKDHYAKMLLHKLLSTITCSKSLGIICQQTSHSKFSPFYTCLVYNMYEEFNYMLKFFDNGDFLDTYSSTVIGGVNALVLLIQNYPHEALNILNLKIPKQVLLNHCGGSGTKTFTALQIALFKYDLDPGQHKELYKNIALRLVEKHAEVGGLTIDFNPDLAMNPFTHALTSDLPEVVTGMMENAQSFSSIYVPGSGKNALIIALEKRQLSVLSKLISVAHPSSFLSAPLQNEPFAGQNFFAMLANDVYNDLSGTYSHYLTRDCYLDIPPFGVKKGCSLLYYDLQEEKELSADHLERICKHLNYDYSSLCSHVNPAHYEKLVNAFIKQDKALIDLFSCLNKKELSNEHLTISVQQILFEYLINNDDIKLKRLKEIIEKFSSSRFTSCVYLLYRINLRDCLWSNKLDLLSKAMSTDEYFKLSDETKKLFINTLEILKPKIKLIPREAAVEPKKAKPLTPKPPKVNEKQAAALAAIEARKNAKNAPKQTAKVQKMAQGTAKAAKVLSKPMQASSSSIKAAAHAAPSLQTKKAHEIIKPQQSERAALPYAKPLSLASSKPDLSLPAFVGNSVPKNGGVVIGHVNKAYVAPHFKPVTNPIPVAAESAAFLTLAKNYLIEIVDIANRLKVESKYTPLYTSMLYYSLFRFNEIMGNHAHTSTVFVEWRNWLRHQHNKTKTKELMELSSSFIRADLPGKLDDIFSGKQIDLAIDVPPPIVELSIEQVTSCLSEQLVLIQNWRALYPDSVKANKFSDPSFIDLPRAVLGSLIHVGSLLAALKSKNVVLESIMQKWTRLANRIAHDSGDASLANYCDVEVIKDSDLEAFYRISGHFLFKLITELKSTSASLSLSAENRTITPSPRLVSTAKIKATASATNFTQRGSPPPSYMALFPKAPTFDPLKRSVSIPSYLALFPQVPTFNPLKD